MMRTFFALFVIEFSLFEFIEIDQWLETLTWSCWPWWLLLLHCGRGTRRSLPPGNRMYTSIYRLVGDNSFQQTHKKVILLEEDGEFPYRKILENWFWGLDRYQVGVFRFFHCIEEGFLRRLYTGQLCRISWRRRTKVWSCWLFFR